MILSKKDKKREKNRETTTIGLNQFSPHSGFSRTKNVTTTCPNDKKSKTPPVPKECRVLEHIEIVNERMSHKGGRYLEG